MLQSIFAFTHPDHVGPDPRQPGRQRARTQPLSSVLDPTRHELCAVQLTDLSAASGMVPGLEREGFTHVELGTNVPLLRSLERVRRAGQLGIEDERHIRRALRGRVLETGDGRRFRVLHIAREGFIMRRQGPGGSAPRSHAPPSPTGQGRETPPASVRPRIHHDAARMVHIDQDVHGTPLRQILRGAAPWVFRHRAPGSINRRAPLSLLNLWIPLDQVVAPLALLDGASLDRDRHQLRYGLPTEAILEERVADRRVNDIWTLLHHPEQRWYFTSELELGRGYLFETLSTAHAAFVLPGEDRAQALLERLEALEAALCEGRVDAGCPHGADLRAGLASTTSAPCTRPLAQSISTGLELIDEAMAQLNSRARPGEVGDPMGPVWLGAWRSRLSDLRRRLTRKSLELRLVALGG